MPASIIWLASFPKSGNTWFRLLLANWCADGAEPVHINDLPHPGGEIMTREAFDEATLVGSGVLRTEELNRLRPAVYQMLAEEGEGPWYVKVHEAFRRNPDGEWLYAGKAVRAAIYLVRDPRDVAGSLAAHFDVSIEKSVSILNSRCSALAVLRDSLSLQLPMGLLGWSGHVTSWLDQKEVRVHLVRYEDLKADTARVFGDALQFLGETADRDRLERAVSHSRFSELQRQEREAGFRARVSSSNPFFRRGQAGAWRSDLTPQLVEQIEQANRVVMERLGYLECAAVNG